MRTSSIFGFIAKKTKISENLEKGDMKLAVVECRDGIMTIFTGRCFSRNHSATGESALHPWSQSIGDAF